ncbi:MAG: hypothetical protein EZS28_006711 [Streblomastix strix]|uniref:Uncharacterized protein n=1 Tax=Streblomastix strix TaxID=222440 RepID=A0A5J4WRR2_9EUKA|nr:MAG: hypothetical protein EZS28_006711 [Streblomastix strix]
MNTLERINLDQLSFTTKQGQAFKLSQTQLPQGTLETLLISEADNSRDPRQRRCKTRFIDDCLFGRIYLIVLQRSLSFMHQLC